ncbi:MAG: type II toxin-antitoxin system HigB family toxin [Flammeovirgaceae bacterium]|nr:type II toxin-antitoxin system HigB family toxin [Flammeovirgaceae bacterium]
MVKFWEKHPTAKSPLEEWYNYVKRANWNNLNDITESISNSRSIQEERVIFKIGGNNFRLIVQFKFSISAVYIVFVGTHAEYDKIDPKTVFKVN